MYKVNRSTFIIKIQMSIDHIIKEIAIIITNNKMTVNELES